MKRSRISRRTPLARGAPLAGGGELKRAPLKRGGELRKSRRRLSESALELATMFGRASRGQRCEVCGRLPARITAHHVVPAQTLRRRGFGPDVVYDVANRLWVGWECCHEAHERASRRIPRSVLRENHRLFAERVGLRYLLDRLYPES